ncbi:hypothetical protein [Stenotrophobium rhamnosiphilum]|uniref:Condensation domain-containing protein n=1 Tax=Stenotrophobium rhamnosiphilum TaxID=2029166 RepID=A0A2T5MKB1_9GAMM|nr:hypothetical protein [Stenotrophobium rhamnosiphilum]PTU33016.1 hypothetical protein CJD38_02570 [Stenotrophobium rhamnosiphilum]
MPFDPPNSVAAPLVLAPVLKPRRTLPPLQRQSEIVRPLSTPEYYHSCVGRSPRTLEITRENGFIFRGEGRISAERWQAALDQVTAVNPGLRLRLVGDGFRARWLNDGQPTRLRIVEDCSWDARSSDGADFVYETVLSLNDGLTSELLVMHQPNNRMLVMLRGHHAVMDGKGAMHFMSELFHALRGEPLLGTNVAFSDVDVMMSVGAVRSTSRHIKTVAMTGMPQGMARGDDWRLLDLGAPQKNMLGRIVEAMVEFTHQHSDLPVSIGVPVDLRRHVPGLISTANFTNMLLVRMEKGEGAEDFKRKLHEMLDQKMETLYPSILDIFKWLPLSWLDRLVSRNEKNYHQRKALETAVVSNLGRFNSVDFSCDGFRMDGMVVVPLTGSVFAGLAGVDDRVELAINIPRVLSSNGRFDAFEAFLKKRLAGS